MRLYTICVHGVPILVISTDTGLPFPDEFTTDAERLAADRATRALLKGMPEHARRISDQRKIDGALDTWLGEDLSLAGLCDGDHTNLHVRETCVDEAEQWHKPRRSAIEDGELEAGDEDWLVFLVSVGDAAADRHPPAG
jgi:hypothetical protein